MNSPHFSRRHFGRRSRGSILVVLLLVCALSLIIAGILSWTVAEHRLNQRNIYWIEARNAAEGVVEYGFATVSADYSSYSTPPTLNPTGPGAPLAPTNFLQEDGLVDYKPYDATSEPYGYQLVASAPTQYPTSGGLYYIDPTDPNNASDPLAGSWVYRRDVQVIARASVVPPDGTTPITAYTTETLSIRGEPLFANAIFYSNNDLEIFPGPTMNIYGPVHVNGNMFISSQGNSLNFHGPVSMTGNIYHSWGGQAAAAGGTGSESLDANPVNFLTGTYVPGSAGTLHNMDIGSNASTTTASDQAASWVDSTWTNALSSSGSVTSSYAADNTLFTQSTGTNFGLYKDKSTPLLTTTTSTGTTITGQLTPLTLTNNSTAINAFVTKAASIWGSNLLTGASNDVASYDPVAYTSPIGVDSSGNLIFPDPHVIIDPPQAISTSDTYYKGESQVESQKLANKAGLFVDVKVTAGAAGSPDSQVITVYGPYNASTVGVSGYGPNGGVALANIPSNLVTFVPYKLQSTATTVGTSTATTYVSSVGTPTATTTKSGSKTVYKYSVSYSILKQSVPTTITTSNLLTTVNGAGISSTSAGTSTTSTGSTTQSTATSATLSSGATTYATSALAVSAAVTAVDAASATALAGYTASTTSTSSTTTSSTPSVISGLYDQRQQAGIDIVQLDVNQLSKAVSALVNNQSTSAIQNSSANGGGIWKDWNGAVYLDVETPSGDQASVGVAHGQVSSGSSLLPSYTNSTSNTAYTGVTIATNAPMYVEGNFNAAGSSSASSASYATTPDDGKTDSTTANTSSEVPVSLAADAITILSPGYFGSASTVYSSSIGTAATTSNTSGTNAYNSYGSVKPSAAYGSGSTSSVVDEVASAFITGLVSTTSTANSGGAHNLPRFIENWGSDTVTIRGSLVSLYSSKVATAPFSGAYYGAPNRNWGFDQIFANGHFPPQVPQVMSFRRLEYQNLSASAYTTEYNAIIASYSN